MEDDPSWKFVAVAQRALSKNIIHPLLVQDRKDDEFRDLPARLLVHVGDRDGDYNGSAIVRRGKY